MVEIPANGVAIPPILDTFFEIAGLWKFWLAVVFDWSWTWACKLVISMSLESLLSLHGYNT